MTSVVSLNERVRDWRSPQRCRWRRSASRIMTPCRLVNIYQ